MEGVVSVITRYKEAVSLCTQLDGEEGRNLLISRNEVMW